MTGRSFLSQLLPEKLRHFVEQRFEKQKFFSFLSKLLFHENPYNLVRLLKKSNCLRSNRSKNKKQLSHSITWRKEGLFNLYISTRKISICGSFCFFWLQKKLNSCRLSEKKSIFQKINGSG